MKEIVIKDLYNNEIHIKDCSEVTFVCQKTNGETRYYVECFKKGEYDSFMYWITRDEFLKHI